MNRSDNTRIGKMDNILFDLDGTLTDPKEGIINSILYSLKKLDISEHSIKELDSFIGPPLRDSFIARYALSNDLADKAVEYYREYFSAKGLFENVLYEGIHELLERLGAQGYQLFVATSKPQFYAHQILSHFNLDKYFVEITGSNLDNTRSNKAEIISHLVSAFNLISANSVMIGDRKHDIQGAKKNSMKSIAVTYGYGSVQELLIEKPDLIVNNSTELESVFLPELPGSVKT